VGSTNDLQRRLIDQNCGKTKYTRQGEIWELKYFEIFQTRQEAYNREMAIKKRKSRKYIVELISSAGSENPDWFGN
jgi:putative endonuclease